MRKSEVIKKRTSPHGTPISRIGTFNTPARIAEIEKENKRARRELANHQLAQTPLPPLIPYEPYKRPRKKGADPTIFDDPPKMREETHIVFDQLSRSIKDPSEYPNLAPENIGLLVRYCELQAWLNERSLTEITDTIHEEGPQGRRRSKRNPEFIQWLNVSRQATWLHDRLLRKRIVKDARKKDKEPDRSDDDPLRADDFPDQLRGAAVEALKVDPDGSLSDRLIPLGLRIGRK